MSQKGSSLPVLLLTFILLTGGFLGFKYISSGTSTNVPLMQTPKASPAVNIYSDKDLGFQFEYPEGFEVTYDDEESYFKISKTEHRKNFTGYVGYKPPEFVKGLTLNKQAAKDIAEYNASPVILWVFNNPDKLSIDSWFDKYWYYPFVWGIFAQPGKGHIYPSLEATISGKQAKSVEVSYQPGKPEFIYAANGDKMFMFRLIKNEDKKIISGVISSFKFTLP